MTARGDALVLFGATGDLARRKLFAALYGLERQGRLEGPIVGVASSTWDDEALRDRARVSVAEAGIDVDEDTFRTLAGRLRYVSGDYRDPDLYGAVADRLGGARLPVCYLAIPPGLFEAVVSGLAAAGLHQGGRVVLEKPFGRDLASARELNRILLERYPEDAVFRIDHFLGKESLQGLLVARFANTIWEPIWNRRYVRAVQITMAEELGVGSRGRFYEEAGALRDVIQNHLLHLVCLLAMEPPVAVDADGVRNEISKVLRAVRPLRPEHLVRAQYRGYRDEEHVAADSSVETFAAARFEIDSWRWAGVPFLVRTGKRLARSVTEAVVEFHAPPLALFADTDCRPEPNQFRYRINPQETTRLVVQAKEPGSRLVGRSVALEVDHREAVGEGPEAYERLLGDAIDGDPRLFARQDAVEQAWRVVDDVVRDPPPLTEPYEPGSWGPAEAEALARPEGGWRECGEPA